MIYVITGVHEGTHYKAKFPFIKLNSVSLLFLTVLPDQMLHNSKQNTFRIDVFGNVCMWTSEETKACFLRISLYWIVSVSS